MRSDYRFHQTDWSFHVGLLDAGKSKFLRFTEISAEYVKKSLNFPAEMFIIREVCVRV